MDKDRLVQFNEEICEDIEISAKQEEKQNSLEKEVQTDHIKRINIKLATTNVEEEEVY